MTPQNPFIENEQQEPINPFLQDTPFFSPDAPVMSPAPPPPAPPPLINTPDNFTLESEQELLNEVAGQTPSPDTPVPPAVTAPSIPSVSETDATAPVEAPSPLYQSFYDTLPKKEGQDNPYNLIPEKIPSLLETSGLTDTPEGHELYVLFSSGTDEQKQAVLNNPHISAALADLKYEALQKSTKESLGGRVVSKPMLDNMIRNYWEGGLSHTAREVFTSGLADKELESITKLRKDTATGKTALPLVATEGNVKERDTLQLNQVSTHPLPTTMSNTGTYISELMASPEFDEIQGAYKGTDKFVQAGAGKNLVFNVQGVASPTEVLDANGNPSAVYQKEYDTLMNHFNASDHAQLNAIVKTVKDNEGGYVLNPYALPASKGNSGITISAGIDLGQMTPEELKNRIGENPALYDKLVTFTALGHGKALTKERGAAVLQGTMDNGIMPILTPEEATYLAARDMNYRMGRMGDISALPNEAKTTLLDVSIQNGVGMAPRILKPLKKAYENTDDPTVFNSHIDQAVEALWKLPGADGWNKRRTQQRADTLTKIKK